MTIEYYIHTHYEEHFIQGKSIDAASFKMLHPIATVWIEFLDANKEKLEVLAGVLNLVYYVRENIVLPRNFDQADIIVQLNAQVHKWG